MRFKGYRQEIESEQKLKSKPNIIIFEGTDKAAKSTISAAMSEILDVPLFGASDLNVFGNSDKPNFFINDLMFGETKLAKFLEQTSPPSLIRDRSFYSEFVYSTIFSRKTDAETIFKLDEIYSTAFNTLVVICTKDKEAYGEIDDHELIISHHQQIDECYKELVTSRLFSTPRFLLNTSTQNLYEQLSKISSRFKTIYGESFS